nr:unnamed protein product [Callosobruchus analis]
MSREYIAGKASSSSESEDSSNDSTSSSSSSDIGDREYRATTQKTVEDIPPQQPGQEIAISIDILGTNPIESAAVGPEIHAEIASRWTTFCRTGLDKDDRKSLIEKYPSPSNVEGLSPPILNAEISACLTENLLKQDKFLSTLQKQIAAAMSAIALPMNVFFSNPSEEMNAHLQHLANGSKLLADVMHSLSRHRRYGLSNTMNNNIRKVVMDRPIEGFLFGEDLSNQIKTAQELKKSHRKRRREQKEPEAKEKLEEVGVQKLVEVNNVGCLYNFYSNWQSITKNPLILDWVKGYKLPIRKKPTQNPPHFKLEDYRSAKYLIHKNSLLCKIDLKNAYYSVSIEDQCRRYLKFQYNGQLFSFNCLPFGLSMAPYIYTKILKPVLTYLRCLGIVCVGYLDDILLITSSYQEGIKNANKVVEVLTSLGFIINKEKSILSPIQECKFLGFTFNTVTMKMSLPFEKKENITSASNQFLTQKNCSIRNLAAYIGVLVAACPATQYGWAHVKLLERTKYLALSREMHNYNKKIEVPSSARNDILWWLKIQQNPGVNINEPSFQMVIFFRFFQRWVGGCMQFSSYARILE